MNETIFERRSMENARAVAANLQAITDYNIMMGLIEDPSEDEEEQED